MVRSVCRNVMCLMYHMCGTQNICLEGPRAVLGAMQHLLDATGSGRQQTYIRNCALTICGTTAFCVGYCLQGVS